MEIINKFFKKQVLPVSHLKNGDQDTTFVITFVYVICVKLIHAKQHIEIIIQEMPLSSVSFLLLFTDLLANSQHQGLFALKQVLLHGHIHIMSNLEKHHHISPKLVYPRGSSSGTREQWRGRTGPDPMGPKRKLP